MWFYFLVAVLVYVVFCTLRIRLQSFSSFKDRNVIITGGSSGIGLAVAIELAKEGANVTIMARTQSVLDDAKRQIEAARLNPSQKVLALSCDVTNYDQVCQCVNTSAQQVGEPHCLITSAGLAFPGYVHEQDFSVFQKTINLNYLGAVAAVKAVLPHFMAMPKSTSRQVVMVSSVLGMFSFVGYASYSPSKYAIQGFADALHNELHPYNIKVSLVYPVDTDTPGFQQENQTKPKECFEISNVGTVAKPEEVAPKIVAGIKRGRYHIHTDPIGYLSGVLMGGWLTPKEYPLLEMFLLPLFAIVGMAVGWFNNRTSYNGVASGIRGKAAKRD